MQYLSMCTALYNESMCDLIRSSFQGQTLLMCHQYFCLRVFRRLTLMREPYLPSCSSWQAGYTMVTVFNSTLVRVILIHHQSKDSLYIMFSEPKANLLNKLVLHWITCVFIAFTCAQNILEGNKPAVKLDWFKYICLKCIFKTCEFFVLEVQTLLFCVQIKAKVIFFMKLFYIWANGFNSNLKALF